MPLTEAGGVNHKQISNNYKKRPPKERGSGMMERWAALEMYSQLSWVGE
jgi:hypothetical protein